MKNHFKNYLKEREDKEVIETETGFATYLLKENYIYLTDIYIDENHRGTEESFKLADLVAAEGIKAGKEFMLGSSSWEANNPTAGIKAMLDYGMSVYNVDKEKNIIYFAKQLKALENNGEE